MRTHGWAPLVAMRRRMLRSGTLMVCLVLAVGAGPALADPPFCGDGKCTGQEDSISCPADCSGDPSNPPFVATHVGAVGHAFDCLVCEDSSYASGDFFDVGTKYDGDVSVCEPLQCAVYAGGSVECGHTSGWTDEPRPRVDIRGVAAGGLFDLWSQDPEAQGNPAECFGNGIVDPVVAVGTAAGEFHVRLAAFFSEVDRTLPGRCRGASDLIKYSAGIGPCFSADNFPPGPGEIAVVTCIAGTAASVNFQGGGGTAKKCGCHATGQLNNTTVIRIRGL